MDGRGLVLVGGVSAVLIALHYYIWRRKVHDAALPQPWRRIATACLVVGCCVVVGAFLSWRLMATQRVGLFRFAAFVWLGSFFYIVVSWAAFDLLRLVLMPVSKVLNGMAKDRPPHEGDIPAKSAATPAADSDAASDQPALDRRAFLSRGFAAVSLLGTAGMATAGVRSALDEITEPVLEVRLRRLPRSLDGFRIVQIADLHIGPYLDGRFVRGVVERVNRLKPDLVAITGDLVDGTVENIGRDIEPLAGLRSRFGSYFVTGNHEFYVKAAPWLAFLPRLGVRVLDNEHVSVGDDASFDLAGIHDPTARYTETEFTPDIDKAVAGRDESRELILLAHQPAQVWAAENCGAGLMLAGHTHGGQLWPFGALVLLGQPYLYGLHRHAPGTQIYVSRGTGFWGPPMRVLAPAEITSIILHAD
ncbi:MAG: metallophosphoesterase [Planctomycetes bacterium]|nr:metallophosphoesterase [Planctomycetota bacterium]